MFVPEILVPGMLVDGLPNEQLQAVRSLLMLLEGGLGDAAIALALYSQASQQRHSPTGSLLAADPQQEQVMKRQLWAAGAWPQQYLFRLTFVHAKSFVYALDQVAKALGMLARQPLAPPIASVITQQETAWTAALPDLKGVRDSSHHAEDRLRRKGKRGQDIQLQPINNEMISAPSGALLAENLINNRFGWTMEDGNYGEVEVSETTLVKARDIVQAVFDAPWSWRGPARWVP